MAKKKKNSMVDIADSLGKKFKGNSLNIQNGSEMSGQTSVSTWISTGSSVLDLASSNKKVGGFPSGRFSVIYGEEQSGKSLLAMHAIAETQKMGGIAVYFDVEYAMPEEFADAIGVDRHSESFFHITGTSLDAILPAIEDIIYELRSEYPEKPITIIIDSLNSLMTTEDVKGLGDRNKYGLEKQKSFSKWFNHLIPIISKENICLIGTSQVRYNLNKKYPHDPKYVMTGGQAIPHFASVIVFLAKSKKIKAESNKVIKVVGRKVRCKIEKNRMGPPEIQLYFDVYYDRGIDDYGSWIDYVNTYEICDVAKNGWISYEYVDKDTGEVIEYKKRGWDTFIKEVLRPHPEVAEEIFDKLCENFLMTYQTNSAELETFEEDDE